MPAGAAEALPEPKQGERIQVARMGGAGAGMAAGGIPMASYIGCQGEAGGCTSPILQRRGRQVLDRVLDKRRAHALHY